MSLEIGTSLAGLAAPIVVLVFGSVPSKLAVLGGALRSATCTVATAVQAAGLYRRGPDHLMEALAQHRAERLRALDDQLRMQGQIHTAISRPAVWSHLGSVDHSVGRTA
jgi:hypothetical protein